MVCLCDFDSRISNCKAMPSSVVSQQKMPMRISGHRPESLRNTYLQVGQECVSIAISMLAMKCRRIMTHCSPSLLSGLLHVMRQLHVCNAPLKSLSLKGSQQRSHFISVYLNMRASFVEIPIHASFRKKRPSLAYRKATQIAQSSRMFK